MTDNIFKDKILKEIKNTFPDFRITIRFKRYINKIVNTIFEEIEGDYDYTKDDIKKYNPSEFVLIDCAFYLRNAYKDGDELYPEDVRLFLRLKKMIKSDIVRFFADIEYCKCRKELMEYVKQYQGE